MVEVNFSYNENETLKRILSHLYQVYFRTVQNYNSNTIDDYDQIAEDAKHLKRILEKLQEGENYFYDHLLDNF